MPSSHEQDREQFQRALDGLQNNAVLPLLPREYPGPIVIRRPIVLDGQGSTIWALGGPVIDCQANGIVLRNIRIEITGTEGTGHEDHCALKVQPGCSITLENVEVRGSVIGIPEEEGDWRYPDSLQIGSVPFGTEHDLILRMWVPVPCEISSKISGLEVQPHRLEPGTNEVTLHIERIAKDTLLSGALHISTPHLKRSLALNGYVSSSRAKKSKTKKLPQVIWQPPDWETLLTLPRPVYTAPLPLPPLPQHLPPPPPLTGNPSEVVSSLPIPAPSPPAQTGPVVSPVIAPPVAEVRPPSPIIQWPPPVSPVVPPPGPPAPPVTSPIVGPSSTPSSLPIPAPPKPSRKLVFVGVLAVLLIMMVAAGWWLFLRGPKKINYTGVEFVRALQATDEVEAVAFSPDGSLVAGGSKNGVIRVWESSTGELKREMPKSSDTSSLSEVTSLAFSPDGKMLAAGRADANVVIWDPQTGERTNTLRGHSARVNSVAFSTDGKTIASGADDTTVKLWDATSLGGQPKSLSMDSPVKAVAFSSDGSIVAGAGGAQDGRLRMWDVATASQKQPEITKSAVITSLSFSKDGKLAAGTADATVVVWNVQSRDQLNTLRGHKSQVNGVMFSPLGEAIVSGGADTSVLLWDTESIGGPSKRALTQNTGPVYAVAVSSDGKWIASAGADKTVKLWTNK